MENLDKLTIILENCDTITLEQHDITYLYMSDFSSKIETIGKGYTGKITAIENIIIIIDAKSNRSHYPFGDKNFEVKGSIFDRLSLCDITGFSICYDSDKVEDYSVIYKEKDEKVLGSPNIFMKTKIMDGDLVIVIGKKFNINKLKIKEKEET